MTDSANLNSDLVPNGPLWKYLSLEPSLEPPWQEKLEQLCIEGIAYCPNPRQFNDPFDCLPQVLSPSLDLEIESGTEYLIEKMINAIPELSRSEIEQRLKQGLLSLDPSKLLEKSQDSAERTVSTMGVFCLSERIDSVLMWSHYATNHRGIALRFDWQVQLRNGLMPLFKVQYVNERPKISYFGHEAATAFPDALTKKAKFWSYEQEWRRIVPNGANQFLQFNPKVITGVVFGINCLEKDREEVRRLLPEERITFYVANPSQDNFSIEFRELKK